LYFLSSALSLEDDHYVHLPPGHRQLLSLNTSSKQCRQPFHILMWEWRHVRWLAESDTNKHFQASSRKDHCLAAVCTSQNSGSLQNYIAIQNYVGN
jgi:hypothetical protein